MTARPTPDAVDVGAPDLGSSGRAPVAGHPGVTVRFDRRGDDVELEVEVDAHHLPTEGPDPGLVGAIAATIADLLRQPSLAGATVHLAADHPADAVDPLPEAVADAVGLPHRRDLLQLRRSLPVPADHPVRSSAPAVATRAFGPGADDAAWLRLNNRSFAAHPDQGHETPATLAARMAEPWFDPAGFLVGDEPTDGERAGELDGFCWTKVHPATEVEPALGEIYVIGTDPSHRGEHLGPGFVLAGLDHLAGLGITVANLYVDATNDAGRRLYDRLGFTTHDRRRVYTA